jgi:hypothetical protein
MTPLILATVFSLLAADAGPAAGPAPVAAAPAADQHTSSADDPDKVICHNEAITGSRFIKRICMKRSDWAEQERRTKEFERKLGESAGFNAAAATGGGMGGSGQ